jgi:CheY-like chemotaxis protein
MARILIIDDESQIRSMLRLMLERVGYEVVEAPDGIEGTASKELGNTEKNLPI